MAVPAVQGRCTVKFAKVRPKKSFPHPDSVNSVPFAVEFPVTENEVSANIFGNQSNRMAGSH
jgi:hypothetical protein